MINTTVLMSDALNFSSEQAINPYYFDSHTNTDRAQVEHTAIRDAFTKAGITVITVPSPTDSQDGVYTANWALVRGNKAVLARLPNVRKAEEAYAKRILQEQGKEVIEVPNDLRFSGQGDALACGDYLFCGSGYRSDAAAQAFAAEALGYTRIQLQTVPQQDENGTPMINPISGWEDSFFYDIDLALSILRAPTDSEPGLIAYCPEAFTDESQRTLAELPRETFETILISQEEAREAFAGNLVSTGTSVIMSAHAPHFQSELEQRGFTVYTPAIHELVKGGGYIRCTSLTLD
ncbi:MAG TPA: arginine deiminase-related protein [Dongiaceae bacterium]|nr:arginine deiminase-related protein [Dongiaceae bacterium]